MNFLIVDDSGFSRKKIADFVTQVGGTVIGEASNGLEAIEQYEKLRPTIVTMDIEMPKKNVSIWRLSIIGNIGVAIRPKAVQLSENVSPGKTSST